MRSGGIFDYEGRSERLAEVLRELEDPTVWSDPDRAQQLGRERTRLESVVGTLDRLRAGLTEAGELLELAEAEGDAATARSVEADVGRIESDIQRLEFQRMFPGEMDSHNAFLDIQAGAGGTEAQDWAQMLMRMYLRWGDKNGFKTEVIDVNEGEVAGIKSASIEVDGDYAYGWLRTETGVHRLVRKSPFDSGNRRHTSFASVFVSPVVDDEINIEVNPADIEMDTYRASGAGEIELSLPIHGLYNVENCLAAAACALHLGIPLGQLQPALDRFRPSSHRGEIVRAPGGFLIELARSGRILAVPPGKSILETVQAAGIAATSSCEAGICGECQVTVLSGIPDHRDLVLSDAERAANTSMMICCSGAKSEKLVLDL